jgi:hypothetical protein
VRVVFRILFRDANQRRGALAEQPREASARPPPTCGKQGERDRTNWRPAQEGRGPSTAHFLTDTKLQALERGCYT